ncbi:MAG TPA: phosphatase PAP2 family protein, partial [Firmicutes bacterium]|nr:phosphatase PAP2 family protein [Bacillota bacterium]
LVYAGGYSFPSGHSLVAFVLFGYLALLWWALAGRRLRWLAWLFLIMPLGIGVSRVYLGVHYPTDVLAGWLMGAAWLAFVWGWGRKRIPGYLPPATRGSSGGGRRWPGPFTMVAGLLGLALLTSLGWQGLAVSSAAFRCELSVAPGLDLPPELTFTLRSLFNTRARGLLTGDPWGVTPLYDDEEEAGRWSREHDQTRISYVRAWASKRSIQITDVTAHVRVGLAEIRGNEAWLEMAVTEQVGYRYRHRPPGNDRFGVGAWHVLHLKKRENRWLVVRDWYSDPLEEAPVVADGGSIRQAQPPPARGSRTDGGVYNRERAVRYADQYCGPAAGLQNHYNRRYRDYSCLGGDCASFVSQVLSDPEAGGLPTDSVWGYAAGKGSRAWVRAEDLVYYLLDSGRATCVGRGHFGEIGGTGQAIESLQPGDVIGYQQGGSIRHVSVVVGEDSSGYLLVNSHTGDRYHVPWDLGWDATTVFWLLHITG